MGSLGLSFFAAADRFGLDIISKLPKHPGAVALFILNLIGCIVLFAQKDIPGMSCNISKNSDQSERHQNNHVSSL
jgi:hypothetical protein